MRRYVDITDIEIPSDENIYEELVEFADAIAEQDVIELPEQRWIPVSERLPEQDGDYIVTIKVHTIDDSWYPDVNYFRYNPKRKPNGWGTYYEDDIIAWMDKPAPYTQE